LALVLSVWVGASMAWADTLKVKVNGVEVPSSFLTRERLREIFFARVTSWPDGSPIHVFVLPDQHPLQSRFAKEVLGVYPYQLRSAWDRMTYSGTGVAPTIVDSEEDMHSRIKSTPGAIGYQLEQADHGH
jgi:ABC-type phosphate transport system substrate-binding protein